MFSAANAPKVARIQADPAATLLVANETHEPEFWVALEGAVKVGASEPILPLLEQLIERYWGPDLSPPQAAIADQWRANTDAIVQLTLVPERIRTG
jgi:hypothetical protein